MKKYLIALALAATSLNAHADGLSCPEMVQIIADLEHDRQSGNLRGNEAVTNRGRLAADYQSYYSGGCKEADLKNGMRQGEKFKTKREVR